ncbi:hypothetical protein HYT05_03440 [Candidatus Kaiserbacteria bacterium]|nr:hypothetical protein [Candidatus Kaiserbacteria bacterium]
MHLLTISLDALGTILIGVAALSVHRRVLRDEKISGKVVSAMRIEQAIGFIGVGMIAANYLIKIIYNV